MCIRDRASTARGHTIVTVLRIRAATESIWSVADRKLESIRDERTRAGIVPRDLRNVREGRTVSGAVSGAPVSAGRILIGVTEIGSPHGYVVGGRRLSLIHI